MVAERFAVLLAGALLVLGCLGGVQARVSKTAIIWTGFGHNTTLGTLNPLRYGVEGGTQQSLTHVSVIAYMIDTNGTFACSCDPSVPWQRPCNNNGTYTDCPWWDHHIRLKVVMPVRIGVMPCITLPPGYDTTGLMKVINSTDLQDQMIFRAVSIAVERNYAGYNIDWEGDTSEITSQELAVFLGRFKRALALFDKKLSFDIALPSLAWNTTALAPSVDQLTDMGTYALSGPALAKALRKNIPLASGVDHYGMGMMPPSLTDEELEGAFGLMAKFDVVNLWAWPDGPTPDLSPLFWSLSAKFLATV